MVFKGGKLTVFLQMSRCKGGADGGSEWRSDFLFSCRGRGEEEEAEEGEEAQREEAHGPVGEHGGAR